MKTFKNFINEQTLQESVIQGYLRSISSKIKGFFSLKNMRFGQEKKKKITVDFPNSLMYDDIMKNESTKVSNQKNNGSQVEALSCLYLFDMLRAEGFGVVLMIDGQEMSRNEARKYVADLQRKIDQNNITNTRDPKARQKIKSASRKAYKHRNNVAYATAERLILEIRSDIDSPPSLFEVIVHSAGVLGEGKTKADFEITVKKKSEQEVAKNFKQYMISHKYDWEKSMGTQFNNVFNTVYSISTGLPSKGAGKNTIRNHVEPILKKALGQDAMEKLERLHFLQGNSSVRRPKYSKEISNQELQDEFELLLDKYYIFMESFVKSNFRNIFKFMGIEENVDHFMVSQDKKTKKYNTVFSGKSEKYKSLYKKVYDDEFLADTSCETKILRRGYLEIKIYWKNILIFSTFLSAQENDSKKSKQIMGGIGIADLDDASSTHSSKY